jgi:diguanylate cyclase (GGDEF)-like protein/putative nucleotidyltransferase with HDIG domain
MVMLISKVTIMAFNHIIKEPLLNILCELPGYDESVDVKQQVRDITHLFDVNPSLPGIIIIDKNRYQGMISRDRCFEALGRPYGIELFSRLSVKQFFSQIGTNALVLPPETPIDTAVRLGLTRDHCELYDPIVVNDANHSYMIDMHTLLVRQTELLSKLSEDYHLLSIHDPLTSINNRRGFIEIAQGKTIDAWVNHDQLSVLMIDIDNFKKVNDIHGHFAGDQVIIAIVDECKKIIRQTDVIGRFGGEEFIVMLPGAQITEANIIAERIRSEIEKLKIIVDGAAIKVTVSIGISQISKAQGSLETLIKQADQAMYTAKGLGKNQITEWDDSQISNKNTLGCITENRKKITWLELDKASKDRFINETIIGWTKAVELRDRDTEGHSQRVAGLTLELAVKIGGQQGDLEELGWGALLHDIGKIAIPDSILYKPGKLTAEEWDIMKKHPGYAVEMLSSISFLKTAIDIPYNHHEHWDGSGYPRGLKNTEIPMAARIFTVIDVWDALSTDRCYRKAWSPVEIERYMVENRGLLFDPDIVNIFLALLREKEIVKKTNTHREYKTNLLQVENIGIYRR